MIFTWTDEEKKYIDFKPFNLSIKEGCPEELRKEIQRKLDLLKRQAGEDE